jgi:hypothetical protein
MTIKNFLLYFRCVFTIEKSEGGCIAFSTEVFRRRDKFSLDKISTTYNLMSINQWNEPKDYDISNGPEKIEMLLELGKREQLYLIGKRVEIENFNPLDMDYDVFMFYL